MIKSPVIYWGGKNMIAYNFGVRSLNKLTIRKHSRHQMLGFIGSYKKYFNEHPYSVFFSFTHHHYIKLSI